MWMGETWQHFAITKIGNGWRSFFSTGFSKLPMVEKDMEVSTVVVKRLAPVELSSGCRSKEVMGPSFTLLLYIHGTPKHNPAIHF